MSCIVKRYTAALTAVCVLLMVWCMVPVSSYAATRPNIIFIVVDDLGYGDITSYGGPISTPAIDSLAQGGVRFTDGYAQAYCTPSRAALLSGQYPQRSGLTFALGANSPQGLPASAITIAELLRSAGYTTGLFGKWHLGKSEQQGPDKSGFRIVEAAMRIGEGDHYTHRNPNNGLAVDWWTNHFGTTNLVPLMPTAYSGVEVTNKALRFITMANIAGQPFLAVVAYQEPHSPFQAPGGTASNRANNPSNYPAMVKSVDTGVGQIMARLRQLGLEQNTLVVFMSDNGGYGPGRNAPLRGKKGDVWEGGWRVPTIAYWPGTIPPQVSHAPITELDWLATFAEIIGTPLPATYKVDGKNILPVLQGGTIATRPLFIGQDGNFAVRYGDWKLVVLGGQPPQLFNLRNDIGETRNVAGANPAIVTQLTDMLNAWQRDVATNRTR